MSKTWPSKFIRTYQTLAPFYRYIFTSMSIEQQAATMMLAEDHWAGRRAKSVEGAIKAAIIELDPNYRWVGVNLNLEGEQNG